MADAPFSFPDEGTVDKLRGDWSNFLSDPRGQAALLSFGTQLLQPMQFGQSPAGAVGTAIGQAGAGAAKVSEQEQKDLEANSKADLRGAQANAAEARSNAASSRLDTAGARLQLMQSEADRKREAAGLSGRIRVQNIYQNHIRDIAKKNQNAALLGTPTEDVPDFRTWLNNNPQLRAIYDVNGGLPDTGGTGATPAGSTAPSEAPAAPSAVQAPAAAPIEEGRTANNGKYTFRGGRWVDTVTGAPYGQ